MPDESAQEPEPSFEQALGQLERIVASLERGEPELTAALAKYEKGVSLLTQCYRLLDQAEQSVALLTGVDEKGNPLTAPFDAIGNDHSRDRRPPRHELRRPRASARETEGFGTSVRLQSAPAIRRRPYPWL